MYEKEDKDFILAAYIANAFFHLGGYVLILLWFLGRGLYSGHPEVKRHMKQITVIWILWIIGATILVLTLGKDVFVATTIGKIYFPITIVLYIIGAIQVWREKDFAIIFRKIEETSYGQK